MGAINFTQVGLYFWGKSEEGGKFGCEGRYGGRRDAVVGDVEEADVEEGGVELREEGGAEVWVGGVREVEDGEV